MNAITNLYFAGFTCADDIAVFKTEQERNNWVSGFNAITNTFDAIAAEDRVALTLADVRAAFSPCESASSADEQIKEAIKTAIPDSIDNRIRWIIF